MVNTKQTSVQNYNSNTKTVKESAENPDFTTEGLQACGGHCETNTTDKQRRKQGSKFITVKMI